MDINSVLLALVVIVIGYYVMKKLPHLIALALTGIILSFVIIFVVRDVWHLPLERYVDVSKFDEYRLGGQDYVSGLKDDIENGNTSEYLLLENLDTVCGMYSNGSDRISEATETLNEKEVIKFSYSTLNDVSRVEIYESLKHRITDEKFKQKLLGMNSYVDITYDLGNALMYNLNGEYLLIEFK